jgi:hypothetical protein
MIDVSSAAFLPARRGKRFSRSGWLGFSRMEGGSFAPVPPDAQVDRDHSETPLGYPATRRRRRDSVFGGWLDAIDERV